MCGAKLTGGRKLGPSFEFAPKLDVNIRPRLATVEIFMSNFGVNSKLGPVC